MARLESQISFTEEVDFNQIDFEKVVGKGAFGVVSKAKWRGMNVAVKMIESEEEIKAFRVEVRQLSRVDHPNIVKLYGASTTQPVCLVMEYAEGGSLYNVLHSTTPQPIYKAAHAMSWALQCARGVDYLHCMKPKKLIHRDLKPANLLLMAGGTVLKICDFGTACDFQTYMTNNKGSAAWMAPEVFEGSLYSEKCDVFSWGVILWEVISRRKPFDDIGGPAFRIMWAVHNGRRPPLIRNIPKPLEKLMTRCWSKEAQQRPSMHEVVRIMTNLMQFFKGADQPLIYPQVTEEESGGGSNALVDKLADQTADMSLASNRSMDSRGSTISDTVIHSSTSVSNGPQEVQNVETPLAFEEIPSNLELGKEQKKRHSMDLELRVDEDNSAKLPAQTHRRSNSYGQILDMTGLPPLPTKPTQATPPQTVIIPASPSPLTKSPAPVTTTSPVTHQPTQSHSAADVVQQTSPSPTLRPPHHSVSVPSDLSVLDAPRPRPASFGEFQSPSLTSTSPSQFHRHSSIELRPDFSALQPHQQDFTSQHAVLESRMGHGGSSVSSSSGSGQGRFDRSQSLDQRTSSSRVKSEDTDISMAYSTLDHHLQPLPPNPKSKESVEIFDEHMRMAKDYLRVQTELALLHTRKKELAEALDQDWKDKQVSFRLLEEFNTLQGEKESLLEMHKRCRSELDMLRLKFRRQQQHLHHGGNRRM
ncbi:mitogen-activated protein kinase kinase kinase 7-like [Diadema setosum]|uniref:mitogen-activated protein kinase kinase kinase 7-like n=1 Tax=Diadema setosum TaxID=31175 RepID=UPI003B3BC060